MERNIQNRRTPYTTKTPTSKSFCGNPNTTNITINSLFHGCSLTLFLLSSLAQEAHAATCGNGSIGDGVCQSDPNLCCSQFGWCDDTSEHCANYCGYGKVGVTCPNPSHCCSTSGYCSALTCAGPTPIPPGPTPAQVSAPISPASASEEDNRLIAYVGGWNTCPTPDQYAQYSHIVLAFAVSYSWAPGRVQCSNTCEISTPPVCNNQNNPALIQLWKSQGKKIILSFGGATMGGSWSSNVNHCWLDCFGREDYVVNRLTEIVMEMDLDGVDIDYEYFYEDNQNGSGFAKGAEAQYFLTKITTDLRQSLPAGSIVTHAPMDPDVVPGAGYHDVLMKVSSNLDFLMPQYYNGFVTNTDEALTHYTTLVDTVFGGDATKIVFGFCVNECGNFNRNGADAATVLNTLSQTYPCHGGAFFWSANADANGAWSVPVSRELQGSFGCSSSGSGGGTNPITANPVSSPPPAPMPPPTPNPVSPPTPRPVSSPTRAPISASTLAPVAAVGGGGNSHTPGNRCGTNWIDAEKCQTSCPGGQDYECPNGETCWSFITCLSGGSDPTPQLTASPTDAGSVMYTTVCSTTRCENDIDCCSERCTSGGNPNSRTCILAPAPGGAAGISGNNCGVNWVDAEKCQVACPLGQHSECPGNEKCWASIYC